MYKRYYAIVLSLTLGLVVPTVLFSVLSNTARPNSTVQPSTQTENNESIMLPVLIGDETVSVMSLDAYITGVLLREMPAEFEIEALKAQAVVARTYTLRRIEGAAKHDTAAVCTNSDCCQGFYFSEEYLNDGGSMDLINKISKAISQTMDYVLVYDNKLIEATYFSCSGGMTEDAAAVWGTDIPYLVATESPGEEMATHYTDTVTFTTAEFADKLGLSVPDKSTAWVESVTYTDGGGVETMRICGRDYTGVELRQKLSLRSTAFVLSVVGDTVTVTTKGFGHRVGMSQYGAEAMALQGHTYEQILAHYYRGTKLISYDEIDNGE